MFLYALSSLNSFTNGLLSIFPVAAPQDAACRFQGAGVNLRRQQRKKGSTSEEPFFVFVS